GSLRYACNTAFLALVYADHLDDAALKARYHDFAVAQVRYALGDNPQGRSYVVALGAEAPRNPHHRTAHGSWANDLNGPADNRSALSGPLGGEPTVQRQHTERPPHCVNIGVACAGRAAYGGARAGQGRASEGTPLAVFPPVAGRDEEIYIAASVNARGPNF